MEIYIASSWKNQHAVEMLTAELRSAGHTVVSFVENNYLERAAQKAQYEGGTAFDFDAWVASKQGEQAFAYDTNGATLCDLVIYIGPSGTDAWAEVGAAWGRGVPIIGLYAKGEQAGLMRRMVKGWCEDYRSLLQCVRAYAIELENIR